MFNWSISFFAARFPIILKIWECASLDVSGCSTFPRIVCPNEVQRSCGACCWVSARNPPYTWHSCKISGFTICFSSHHISFVANMLIASTLFIIVYVVHVILSSFDFLPIWISLYKRCCIDLFMHFWQFLNKHIIVDMCLYKEEADHIFHMFLVTIMLRNGKW